MNEITSASVYEICREAVDNWNEVKADVGTQAPGAIVSEHDQRGMELRDFMKFLGVNVDDPEHLRVIAATTAWFHLDCARTCLSASERGEIMLMATPHAFHAYTLATLDIVGTHIVGKLGSWPA